MCFPCFYQNGWQMLTNVKQHPTIKLNWKSYIHGSHISFLTENESLLCFFKFCSTLFCGGLPLLLIWSGAIRHSLNLPLWKREYWGLRCCQTDYFARSVSKFHGGSLLKCYRSDQPFQNILIKQLSLVELSEFHRMLLPLWWHPVFHFVTFSFVRLTWKVQTCTSIGNELNRIGQIKVILQELGSTWAIQIFCAKSILIHKWQWQWLKMVTLKMEDWRRKI